MTTKEQALEILDRFEFFQGQRAGRELWSDKPVDVQERDIADFSRDVALLKEYISAADVAPRAEWISVEEMVPGGNGVFLVALKESGYENLVYFDVRRYEDGEWRNIPDKLTVSHWMPLPDPPKGE